MDSFDDLEFAGRHAHRVQEHRGEDDPDDAQEPESVPSANAEAAAATGILKTRQEIRNAAMTPKNAA